MSADQSQPRRNVVVTGTSSGIGRATALALAAAGYHVFAGVRHVDDGETLRQAARGDLTPVQLDVTDADSVAAAAEQVAEATGDAGIAGLINNAGIGEASPMEIVPADTLRRIFDVNVVGQVAVIQAFLPLIRQATGRIVNIGSVGDRLTMAFAGPLTSSKWAIASITEALRLELRPWGIHVVLIEPASIHTDAVDKLDAAINKQIDDYTEDQRALYAADFRAAMGKFLAQERAGDPPDVVATAILRALSATTPKTRYLAGKDSRKLAFIARVAPDRIFDRIRVKLFNLPKEFGSRRDPLPRLNTKSGKTL